MEQRVRETWEPPVSSPTVEDWASSADRLGEEPDTWAALIKFNQLDREVRQFERLVAQAAGAMACPLDR
jgi:hypothetical protein